MGRYFEEKDFEALEFWFQLRHMPQPDRRSLPKTGWFVERVGAGFLYRTDSNVGMLDVFITNPRAMPQERREALKEISQKLIETAHRLGIKLLKCDTQVKSIMDLAEEFQFRKTGKFESFTKEL